MAAPYGDPGRPGQGRRAVAWGAEAEMNSRLGSSQPQAWRVLGGTTRQADNQSNRSSNVALLDIPLVASKYFHVFLILL